MLRSVDKVKAFVDDMSQIKGDVLLMGIFSLDLSNPLQLEIEDWKEEYVAVVEKYLYS